MELIYLDSNMVEQGVIKDFTIDLAIGKDENNYEIKTPENEMLQGWYWHIDGTNYGGVVDSISKVSNERNVTYKGRSLEGVIASYSAYQLKEDNYISINNNTLNISGKPSEVAKAIVGQLGIPMTVADGDTNEKVVNINIDRGTDIYQLLRAFVGYKVVCGIDKSNLTLQLTGTVDYTNQEYFDASEYAINISSDSNVPNHLIGVYKTDDSVYIKHLYLDEDGNIQPYSMMDSMHVKVLHDYEYERVEGEKVIDGLDERIAVIEGGSTIENYDLVTPLTDTDGNTPFTNNVPSDWNTNWQDYYAMEWDDDAKEEKFVDLPKDPAYKVLTIPNASWWQKNWGGYYKLEDGEYVQLSDKDLPDPRYRKVASAGVLPSDWKTNWQNYYRQVTTGVFQHFDGVTIYDYKRETSHVTGDNWDTDRGSYYIKWKRYQWKIEAKVSTKSGKMTTTKTIIVKDSLKNDSPDNVHSFAWYKEHRAEKKKDGWHFKLGIVTWVIHEKKVFFNDYITLEDYCNETGRKLTGKGGIKWGEFKVYTQYELRTDPPSVYADVYEQYSLDSDYPDITKTYYEQDGFITPKFEQGLIYRKVYDHYTNLIQTMLEKLQDIKDSAVSIDCELSPEIAEFDVGDIIGGTYPFTDEVIQSTVNKKIIKGDSNKIDITYEV